MLKAILFYPALHSPPWTYFSKPDYLIYCVLCCLIYQTFIALRSMKTSLSEYKKVFLLSPWLSLVLS